MIFWLMLLLTPAPQPSLLDLMPPVHTFNIGRPHIAQRSYGVGDSLAPSPIWSPRGKSGFVEIKIPDEQYRNFPEQGGKLKVRGRTFIVGWNAERQVLWIKEDLSQRGWSQQIQDFFLDIFSFKIK